MNNKILLKKTGIVTLTTVITMLLEIYFGLVTNSMALLADGFHMGTHCLAFLITLFVCYLAIKSKEKEEKLNALGGYTSAIFLGLTSVGILIESINRFIHPLTISFSQAILVAIIGLVVNGICIFIMEDGEHHHCHCHEHKEHHHSNLNYKAAYFHILADALTSIFAIIALLLAKYFNLVFLDPIIGLVGAFVIAKWSIELIRKSFKILI